MNSDYFITRLSDNREVFASLSRNVSKEQASWKPAPDKWSMLEVINHLYDEEREDFRQRLALTLRDPGEEWPRIDPRGWVITRKYSERELATSLDNFLTERDSSLLWLKELAEPNWQHRHRREQDELTAGDLLASWLAHDFLHIRQLARLQWQFISILAAPFDGAYGGPWQES